MLTDDVRIYHFTALPFYDPISVMFRLLHSIGAPKLNVLTQVICCIAYLVTSGRLAPSIEMKIITGRPT